MWLREITLACCALFLAGGARADSTAMESMPVVTDAYGVEGQPCRYHGDAVGVLYGKGSIATDIVTGRLLSCQAGLWEITGGATKLATRIDLSPAKFPNYLICFEGAVRLIFKDITFSPPFDTPPTVATAYSRLYELSGCLQSATDAEKSMVTNVTRYGFRIWSGGSPFGAGCGYAYDGWWYPAFVIWIATDN